MVRVALILIASLFVTSISQAAFLNGTTVFGSATYGGGGPNYFDAGNGFVPAGFGNSSPNGPSVVVGPIVEFGYLDGASSIQANFSDTGLTLTFDPLITGSGFATQTYVFQDIAFVGATVAQISNNFNNGGLTRTLVGNTLTLTYAGGSVNASDVFVANFSITPQAPPPVGNAVPAPAGLLIVGLGVPFFGLASRFRRRVA